jgi:cell division septal protein FtsQ
MATNGQPTAVGIVSAAHGEVFAKGEDGQMRRLNVGDTVFEGDVIVTANGSSAEITAFSGSILNVAEQQTVSVNGEVVANVPDATAGAVDPLSVAEAATVIQQDPAAAALDANLLLEEEAAAAGLDGGDAGGGDFVDLARVVETAGGASYDFPTNPEGTPPTIDGEPAPLQEEPVVVIPPPVVIVSQLVSVDAVGEVDGIFEGGQVRFTVTLDQASTGDVTIQLSNGATVVVPAGQLSGSSAPFSVQGDDPYVDSSQESVSITGIFGGGANEVLSFNPDAVPFEVKDTIDTTTVSVERGNVVDGAFVVATGNVVEGSTVTFRFSVDNAPVGTALVLQTSVGEVTIPVGETSASVTVNTRVDDSYIQGNGTVSATVTSALGGSYEAIDISNASASATVVDDQDVTTVSVERGNVVDGAFVVATGNVVEGSTVTFRFSVDNAPVGTALVLQTSVGEVTIPVGETSASVTVNTRVDDSYIQGNGTVSATVTSALGGSYEAIDISNASASATVVDDQDVTTVSVERGNVVDGAFVVATGNVVEGSTVTFRFSVDNAPVGTALVLQTSVGEVTIPVGERSASVTVNTRVDDSYIQGNGTVSATVTSALGGSYEAIDISNASASATVVDDQDVTTVSVERGNVVDGAFVVATGNVVEGSTVTFRFSVDNAPVGTALVLQTSVGEVTIPVGERSASVTVNTRVDDSYIQGNGTVSATVTSALGGSYEAIDISNASASATVVDDQDVTTVSVERGNVVDGAFVVATGNVVEGSTVTFRFSVDNAPVGTALVLQTSVGEVTIPVGERSASVTVNTRVDDSYIQGNGTVSATVTSALGGSYEAIDISNASASATVVDDQDVTTVSVERGNVVDGAFVVATGNVVEGSTVTFRFSVDNAPVGTALVLQTSVGEVTIPVGETSASVTVNTRVDDSYIQGNGTVSATVTSALGGSYEAIDISNASASATVVDDQDVTTVSVERGNVVDGAFVVATGNVVEGSTVTFRFSVDNAPVGTALVLQTSVGEVTIPVGERSASVTVNTRVDDSYIQGNGTVSATVTSALGGSYEAIDISNASASATVVDDQDVTTVSVERGNVVDGAFVVATGNVVEGSTVTFRFSVDNAPVGTALVLQTSVGEVTIPVGETSASVTVNTRVDDSYIQGNGTVSATVTSALGGSYEAIDISNASASATVVDDQDVTRIVLGEASYLEGSTQATITATIDSLPLDGPLVLTLSNGATLTFTPGGANTVTSSAFTVPVTEHGGQGSATDASITSSITAVVTSGGGEFEKLTIVNGALTILDDVPRYTIANDGNQDGVIVVSAPNASTTHNVQLSDWTFGADGYEAYSLSSTVGSASIRNDSGTSGQVVVDLKYGDAVVGVLTLNADGSDSLQVLSRPKTFVQDELLTGEVTASGPALVKEINSSISGLKITVTGSDGNAIPGEASDEVNPSTQGWAIKDNQIDQNESIKFSFSQAVDTFSFKTNGFTGNPSGGQVGLKIVVTYANGTTEDFYLNSADNGLVNVHELQGFGAIDGSKTFSSIQVISNTEIGKGVDTQDHNDGFRLNNVTVGQYKEMDPVDLNYQFKLAVTDGDGDKAEQLFNITLSGSSAAEFNVEAVVGTVGADTLVGSAGNDVVIGGAGNDILYGGIGADTFVWNLVDLGSAEAPAYDVVKDFSLAEGDKLNLSDVLSGTGNTLAAIAGDGNHLVLQIKDASAQVIQEISLETVSATSDAAAQTVLVSMLTNNQIISNG